MDKETIILILNGVFIAFLALGFLFGLRGLKKAGLRFVFILISVILALFTAHLVTNLIIGIELDYNGTVMPIKDIMISYITEMADVSDLLDSSPTLTSLIQNIPVMVGNCIAFVVLTYVYSFLTWIIYLICASAFIKYKENDAGKPIKHRFLGGLVGAVQGLVLVCVTFVPITGVFGIVQELKATTVEAATEQTKKSPTASILEDDLPEIANVIIDAYDECAINKVSSVGSIGQKLFNNTATVTIKDANGKAIKISLRDEVVNISKAYDSAYYISENFNELMNLDLSVKTIKSLNYDNVKKTIDYALSSNILKAAVPDLVNFYIDEFAKSDEIKADAELADLLTAIKTELNSDNGVLDNIKNEIIGLVDVVKIVAQSNIIDNLPLQLVGLQDGNEYISSENLNVIVDELSKNDKEIFNKIADDLFNSKLLNKAALFGINKGVDFIENWFSEENNEEVLLGNVDITKDSNNLKKAEFKSMFSSLLNIVEELINVDFDKAPSDYTLLFDIDFPAVINNAGVMMNAVQNMSVFKNTGIYNNIITQLNKTKYNKYVDFEVFKQDNIWINETKALSNSVDKLLKTNLLSYIKHNENGSYDFALSDLTKVLNSLKVETDNNGKNETILRQIVAPIYESRAYQKIIDFGFEKLNDVVKDFGNRIKEGTDLGKLNLKNIHSDSEKENILSFLDNATIYISTLDLDEVKAKPFITLLDSDFALFGRCLDSLKNTQMFSDVKENEITTPGVYTNLVNTLKETSYNEYINFECFLDKDFSFNTELASINPSVKRMLTKQISYDDKQTSLIEYIAEVGDWEVIFNQIEKDDIREIFTPLMNSKAFEPIGTLVVNKINEQIKSIVGDEYGEYINIDRDEKLSEEEIEMVIEVIETVTSIISDVTADDFEIGSYIESKTEEELEDMANMLNTLQENANMEDGVFTEAYNAMVDYIEDSLDSEISTIITNNTEEGQIDWAQVLADYKEYLANK